MKDKVSEEREKEVGTYMRIKKRSKEKGRVGWKCKYRWKKSKGEGFIGWEEHERFIFEIHEKKNDEKVGAYKSCAGEKKGNKLKSRWKKRGEKEEIKS